MTDLTEITDVNRQPLPLDTNSRTKPLASADKIRRTGPAETHNSVEDGLTTLEHITHDLIAGRSPSTWTDTTSALQGGFAAQPRSSSLWTAATLAAVRIGGRGSISLGSRVDEEQVGFWIPEAADPDHYRARFTSDEGDVVDERLTASTIASLGVLDGWRYYRFTPLVGSGVGRLALRAVGDEASIGSSHYAGTTEAEQVQGTLPDEAIPEQFRAEPHSPAADDDEISGISFGSDDYEIVDAAGRLGTAAVSRSTDLLSDELHGLGLSVVEVSGDGWVNTDADDHVHVGYAIEPGVGNEANGNPGLTLRQAESNVTPTLWLPHGARPEGYRVLRTDTEGNTTVFPRGGEYWRSYTSGSRVAEDTFHLVAYYLASETSDARIGVSLARGDTIIGQRHPIVHRPAISVDSLAAALLARILPQTNVDSERGYTLKRRADGDGVEWVNV